MLVDTLGRGVGQNGDAVDAGRIGEIVADAVHLPFVVEIRLVEVDAIPPILECEAIYGADRIGRFFIM